MPGTLRPTLVKSQKPFKRRIVGIANHDEDHRRFVLHRAPQRLHRVLNRAISHRANNAAIGMSHLQSDRSRQTKSEYAVPHRVKRTRLFQLDVSIEIALG